MRIRIPFFLVLITALQTVTGQTDNLVSKGIGSLQEGGQFLWAFDEDHLSYSRIDLFAESPKVYSESREKNPIYPVGSWRGDVIGFGPQDGQDSLRKEVFYFLNENELGEFFSLKLKGAFDLAINMGGRDILVFDSLVIGAFGTGGIAAFTIKSQGFSVDAVSDTMSFRILGYSDSIIHEMNCVNDQDCDLEPIRTASHEKDSVVSVDLLAADRFGPDSILLLLVSGETDGEVDFRRGWLGSGEYKKVSFGGNKKPRITDVEVNPNNHLIWGFTKNRIFVSSDTGLSFHRPSSPAMMPDRMVADLHDPRLTFHGDTTIISFGFTEDPGIVMFVGDSAVTYTDYDSTQNAFFLEPELSSVLTPSIKITSMTSISDASRTIIAAGTDEHGIFYRFLDDTSWQNLNKLRKVSAGLAEVITFPTIFDGSKSVRFGYQLEKNSRVTITIFNYAMEKVRTVVENSPRIGGGSRSENPEQDRWNGKDDNHGFVSAGMYYALVESDEGEKGWGKIMVVNGRR